MWALLQSSDRQGRSTWNREATRLTLQHSLAPATMSSVSLLLSSCSTYSSTSKSRLQSLYSDISRQKHSNPTSYHAHVSWWQRTLEELVSRGWQTETTSLQKGQGTDARDVERENQSNKLVFGARRVVVDRLRYDGVGKPLGLASTIVRAISFPCFLSTETDDNLLVKAELQRNRALFPLFQFLTSQHSVYDPGWLPYRIASFLVGKPLWWAMEQLEIVRSEDAYSEAEMWKRVEGEYVLLGLVERAADVVEASSGGLCLADRLYTVTTFRKAFGSKVLPGVSLSETDTRVLLKYLERDRSVLVQDKDVRPFGPLLYCEVLTELFLGRQIRGG